MNSTVIRKVFSSSIVNRTLQAFDKTTMVIIVVSWSSAVLIMIFALYALSISMEAKKESLEVATKEPTLLKIVTHVPPTTELQPLLSRLEERFPDITFHLNHDRTVTVSAQNPENFRKWLTTLSYIDTISPWYRWQITTFCVGGTCSTGIPMTAILKPETISFSLPED